MKVAKEKFLISNHYQGAGLKALDLFMVFWSVPLFCWYSFFPLIWNTNILSSSLTCIISHISFFHIQNTLHEMEKGGNWGNPFHNLNTYQSCGSIYESHFTLHTSLISIFLGPSLSAVAASALSTSSAKANAKTIKEDNINITFQFEWPLEQDYFSE